MTGINNNKKIAEWEIIHWPIKCRGNFIRLVFAECGIPFKETSGWDITAGLIQSTHCGTQNLHPSLNNVSMAPPYIRKIGDARNKSMISQCVVATQFLADKFGLRPKSDLHHAQCGMIIANCNDAFSEVFTAITRLKWGAMNENEFINDYFLKRFQKWLSVLETPLKREKNQKYLFENRITQSDLALYNVMEGFNEWLGQKLFKRFVRDRYPKLSHHYDLIKKTSKGVKELTKIQNDIGFTWWPYECMGGLDHFDPNNDAINIKGSRRLLLKSNL